MVGLLALLLEDMVGPMWLARCLRHRVAVARMAVSFPLHLGPSPHVPADMSTGGSYVAREAGVSSVRPSVRRGVAGVVLRPSHLRFVILADFR